MAMPTAQNYPCYMLQCGPMTTPSQLNCNGHIFDLRSGKVNGHLVLVGTIRAHQGRQIDGVDFQGNQLIVLQMAKIDQT